MKEREFMPIMGGVWLKAIPWGLISPHEDQAQRNHRQTLDRLAQRGGLCPSEAVAIIAGNPWPSASTPAFEESAEHVLIALAWTKINAGASP